MKIKEDLQKKVAEDCVGCRVWGLQKSSPGLFRVKSPFIVSGYVAG